MAHEKLGDVTLVASGAASVTVGGATLLQTVNEWVALAVGLIAISSGLISIALGLRTLLRKK